MVAIQSTWMRLLSLVFIILVFCFDSIGQNKHLYHATCAHQHTHEKLYSKAKWTNYLTKGKPSVAQRSMDDKIIIPIVFHVIYNQAVENITTSQILDQLYILNSHFTDANIEFQLAVSDPYGNSQIGVTRTQTSVVEFDLQFDKALNDPANTAMKKDATGGKTAWDTNKYLNVWICNVQDNYKGFAPFPDLIDQEYEGIVMNYTFIGSIGTGNTYPAYNEGKGFVHEVGHYLNLWHIWGEGGCSSDDFVTDTPEQETYLFGCPQNSQTCGSDDLINNFMQYTDDACISNFTSGQNVRMRDCFYQYDSRISFINDPIANITQFVFADDNQNGIFDDDELGISNVTVDIFDCNNQFVQSSTTDSYGRYTFNQLPSGNYYIQLSNINDWIPSASNETGHPYSQLNENWRSDCFEILQGEQTIQFPIGLKSDESGDLLGKVWHDRDGDGSFNFAEEGIQGIKANLFSSTGQFVESLFTDIDGYYHFTNIPAGDYFLEFDNINDFEYTDTNDDSSVNHSNGIGTTNLFSIISNQTTSTVHAGIFQCATIGDFVWNDSNANGLKDNNETGLANKSINIYRKVNNSWELNGIAQTNQNGEFSYCTAPGEYYLEFMMDGLDMVPTDPFMGNENFDSNVQQDMGITNQFSIFSGDTKLDIDAGYYAMSTVQGTVWIENNGDYLINNNEELVQNIQVSLYDEDDNVMDQTETDLNGQYSFDYIQAKPAYLVFSSPDSGDFLEPELNANHDGESYVDHSNGYGSTSMIYFEPGMKMININAGIINGALPLHVSDLSVDDQIDCQANLYWESYGNGFESVLERSHAQTSTFLTIHQSSNQTGIVSFEDKHLNTGLYYYRLNLYDTEGNYIESTDIVTANISCSEDYKIYYDAFTHQVEVISFHEAFQHWEIIDITGKSIYRSNSIGQYNAGSLPSGIYLLRLKIGDNSYSHKLIF